MKRIMKVKVMSNLLILLPILFISLLHGITKPVFLGYLNFKFCNHSILLSYKYSLLNFAVFCYFRIGKEFAKYCTECMLLSDTALCTLSNSYVCGTVLKCLCKCVKSC